MLALFYFIPCRNFIIFFYNASLYVFALWIWQWIDRLNNRISHSITQLLNIFWLQYRIAHFQMTSTSASAKIISCIYLCISVCVSSELGTFSDQAKFIILGWKTISQIVPKKQINRPLLLSHCNKWSPELYVCLTSLLESVWFWS